MKAYKLEILVIDNECVGKEDIITLIERTKYIYPQVKKVEEADIGEWTDDHPLNKKDTHDTYYDDLFHLSSGE